MSLLTSRDSHSLDTYQSRDPRIKIAAQRIAPLEYMLKVIENIPPKSFVGLDWIRNRCGRSLERMGMIRLTSKGRDHPPSRRNTECFTRIEHGTVRIPFRPRLSLVVLDTCSRLFVAFTDTESDEMSTRTYGRPIPYPSAPVAAVHQKACQPEYAQTRPHEDSKSSCRAGPTLCFHYVSTSTRQNHKKLACAQL